MSREQPWSKFWWSDWQSDLALKSCSYAARGLWMDMLAIMYASDDEGHLLINGRPVGARQLAGLTNGPEKQVVQLLAELRDNGVFSERPNGVIYSRRMIRDKDGRAQAREWGMRGGNPDLKPERTKRVNPSGKGGVNPPLNGHDNDPLNLQEARSKKQEEPPVQPPIAAADAPPLAAPTRGREARGIRLPDDWQPSPSDAAFASDLGLDAATSAAEFRDYWHGVPGAKGRKLDWPATWRNRCRDRAARLPQRAGQRRETPSEERRRKLGIVSPFDMLNDPATIDGEAFHVRQLPH